jgi:L-fucose isomerase-like protein
MIQPLVGFIVYGVHKDGLLDPMGAPFIDDGLIAEAKDALRKAGLQLLEHPTVIASKAEANEALSQMKKNDQLDAVILFSGTWVWAAHLVGAIRDFAASGKAVVLWTHPRSQGWRPVGGLVLHGGLLEIGVPHRFIYGDVTEPDTVARIVSSAQAAHLKNSLNLATVGAFGGRGMGQTCGVADPSQWMRMFGIDIDSRDTTEIIRTAENVPAAQVEELKPRLRQLFGREPESNAVNERSIQLYLALKQIVERENYLFYTIQSFPGLADDFAATCFAQSMMLEDGHGTSTLSDFNTALTVYLLTRLSSERVYYGDLQHIDRRTNEIKIIGDGACPPSLAGKLGPAGFAEHGIPTEGEAGGLSVRLICKPGEGVLARVGRVNGEMQMIVTRASVVEPAAKDVQRRLDECGIPFWPHGFVMAHCDIDVLLQNWTNEYACLGYGEHLYAALAQFCELTGVKPILL